MKEKSVWWLLVCFIWLIGGVYIGKIIFQDSSINCKYEISGFNESVGGYTYAVNGVPEYIVINVGDRDAEEIYNTFFHEMTHVYNRWEKEHFFKWDFDDYEVEDGLCKS